MIRHPGIDSGQGSLAEFPEFNAGMVTNNVLRVCQQIAEVRRTGVFNYRPVCHEGVSGINHAPDPALGMIPAGIAHRILRMSDDRARKIRDIERTVETEIHIHRTERRIRRCQ